jgi:hypothetical protein
MVVLTKKNETESGALAKANGMGESQSFPIGRRPLSTLLDWKACRESPLFNQWGNHRFSFPLSGGRVTTQAFIPLHACAKGVTKRGQTPFLKPLAIYTPGENWA